MTDPLATKVCTICQRALPATDEVFVADNRLRSKIGSRCKECDKERCRARKQGHKLDGYRLRAAKDESDLPPVDLATWPRMANGRLMNYWELEE